MMITKSEPTLCANCLSGIGFVLMHLEKMWTLDKNLSAMMITKSEPTLCAICLCAIACVLMHLDNNTGYMFGCACVLMHLEKMWTLDKNNGYHLQKMWTCKKCGPGN